MSCCWADYDNDGRQDIYVPSMWEAAGQRVSQQKQFHPDAPQRIRELYQRHARGNALYRNQGDGTFANAGHEAKVEMGRWSWSSDFWDFDHDGYPDLYVANGYLSEPEPNDLASFFWRQVVAKSSDDATPSLAYEHGWNAINELVRSDNTWHGFARNVLFLNNHDGTFTEASGAVGMDFLEDSRAFALADIDHDGRLEVVLKNRNAPQLRILHNTMKDIGHSISFRLRGHKSNRDGIGTAITVEAGPLRQTKYLQAGSGFLSQHSKELFFGLGEHEGAIKVTVRWPSGITQTFDQLPLNHRIEIAEGSESVSATPYSPSSLATPPPPATPVAVEWPTEVETWLIQPLKAPEFSLPDLTGNSRTLTSFRDDPALLTFWSTAAEASLQQLKDLDQHSASITSSRLHILAINVDEAGTASAARAYAAGQHFSFPVLFATQDVAGIYSLIYRHLYDRRRDLPIPISFLLDKDGMIVKVYQGQAIPERVMADATSIPGNATARMLKALPFPGLLVQEAFQRNDFTYGVAMYQHGYFDQAAESFQQVIAAKPGNADAYYNLGTLNLRRNNFDQARQYLEQTLKLRPDYPEAWNNLGMMAAQQGRPDEAIQNFQQSLALRPNYAIAYLNLGNVYRRQHDFDKAQDSLTSRSQLCSPMTPRSATASACSTPSRTRCSRLRTISNAPSPFAPITQRPSTISASSSCASRTTGKLKSNSTLASALPLRTTSPISTSPVSMPCAATSKKPAKCCGNCSGCSPVTAAPNRLWECYNDSLDENTSLRREDESPRRTAAYANKSQVMFAPAVCPCALLSGPDMAARRCAAKTFRLIPGLPRH